ncbi:unnamed protein product [Ectocarpus sp. 12 AP-2014]
MVFKSAFRWINPGALRLAKTRPEQPGLSSYGIMDRNSVSKANDVTFGASASQTTPLDGNKVCTRRNEAAYCSTNLCCRVNV